MANRLGRRGLLRGAASLSALAMLPRTAHAAAMNFDEARHLLSRTAFGATPAEIQAFESMDYAAAVDRLLATFRPQAATPAPSWVNEGLVELQQKQKLAVQGQTAEKQGVGDKKLQIVRPIQEQGRELRNWWIEEMLVTDQPLVERMVLFWHNHFTSSLQKVRFAPALYWQNVLFRTHALGNFAALLKGVVRDPAMLIYLDGVRSQASQPNENLGREMLELFTLGEGHYTEADIKAAARAFTGLSIDRQSGKFQFHPQQHDTGAKTFLNQTGNYGADEVVAIILRQPRTAETIVEKLWREFVSLTPDPAEIKRLAAVLRDGGYEMKSVLRALFLSSAFRDPVNHGALIKSPIDLVIGTVRVLGLPVTEKTQLARMMQGLGQVPFDPPNVKGWPGGENWISTNTLLLRQQDLRRIIEATTVSPMDNAGMASGPMMAGGPGKANRRADRRQQLPAQMSPSDNMAQSMERRPIEGRSLRGAGGEARLGPTLASLDGPALLRTLLPRAPIESLDVKASAGAVVAAALLDPAYQLK
jgi:uncharacterized protein (DUF1800 family)